MVEDAPQESYAGNGVPQATRRQAAIRLLACMNAAAEPVEQQQWPDDVVGVVRSQMKLQALDFWMRYPDYLANELLNECDRTGDRTLIDEAARILDSREPELRRFPMVRYLFGAFEPLDDALALLCAYDFVRIRREGVPGHQVREHIYLLTQRGRDAMGQIIRLANEFDWYNQRAALIARVAGGCGGKALKDRQYLQAEYSNTKLGKVIAPITERVRARLASLKE